MKTITVSASRTYDIRIGHGLLTPLGEAVRGLGKVEKVFSGQRHPGLSPVWRCCRSQPESGGIFRLLLCIPRRRGKQKR